MDEIRITKDGLNIPGRLLRGLGPTVAVHRDGDALIIEPPRRLEARKRFAQQVRAIRRAAKELGPLTVSEIAVEVDQVRRQRARRR
jgi:hypothetical protein